jgi:hypothetical protein
VGLVTALLRHAFTTIVTAAMFLVRMAILSFMALLQLTLGGADIRPVTPEAAAA